MTTTKISARNRVISIIGYAIVLATVQYSVVEPQFLPMEKSLWLYNGFASLLFGSRLLNPHFTPPVDAATNGFIALTSVLAAATVIDPSTPEMNLIWVLGIFCGIIMASAILVLLLRSPIGLESRHWILALDRAVRSLGNPNVIFTVIILGLVIIFHRTDPIEVFSILMIWTIIVSLQPIEACLGYIEWFKNMTGSQRPDNIVGLIAAHQSPSMVLIRQLDDKKVPRGTPLVISDDQGPTKLGLSLNYVGRDEGNLLRVITFSVPNTLVLLINSLVPKDNVCAATELVLTQEQKDNIPDAHPSSLIKNINKLCGIVDQDTVLDTLQFEVINDKDLSEGKLVETLISGQPVLYQIIGGVTWEEVVQQKNKFGYVRARAQKIGRWVDDTGKFVLVNWLPHINTPVLIKDTAEHIPTEGAIGHFPGTNYSVGYDASEAVTHNTAILGILGIGKSFLAIEQVERMIAKGIKVICLDLTNQYVKQLTEFLDPAYEEQKLTELKAVGGKGLVKLNKDEGGTKNAFKNKFIEQFTEFLDPTNDHFLKIYNPAKFDVWQQTGGLYNNAASMAALTPCEITAIISDAVLIVSQKLGMTDDARVCLVYEEAHSLVPEWKSVVNDGDKVATATSARAILQGRKYGLGCLLITQRTANVTKTILNQCNSIFAMRTFDDTGKDFLSNFIGKDYANVLPSLEERHVVFFGKASTCDNPVLIRLNDRNKFIATFRKNNLPKTPRPTEDV